LPHTVESLTGGGGQHLYFRHPGTEVPSRPVAPGLDVKGDGGLVVSPPSIHLSGRAYVWETGCAPADVVIADVPSWLLSIVLETGGSPTRPRGSAREIPPRTEGERRAFAELWAEVGVELQPGDRNYLCPFHADHHPSLHIDAEGCRFYCFGCARGGGTGRLRRLVSTHHGAAPPLPTISVPGTLGTPSWGLGTVTLEGETDINVLGVLRYQDALLDLTGGRRHYGGVHMGAVARLVPEVSNTADPGAIVVTIAAQTVGYLSAADAERHRDAIVSAIGRSGEATCAATIVGGWEREHGDVGYFGVRLRL
jgi:hypothetical protein